MITGVSKTKAPLTQEYEVNTIVNEVFFSLRVDFAEVCVSYVIRREHFLKLRVHFRINLAHSQGGGGGGGGGSGTEGGSTFVTYFAEEGVFF